MKEEIAPLPIPQATMKREGRYQDAARLYIHKRVTDMRELMRLCNIPSYEYLRQVKAEDQWEAYCGYLAAQHLGSFWGKPLATGAWSPDTVSGVVAERDRQLAMVPDLVGERNKVLKFMSETEPSDKAYRSMAMALATLNAELERITGWSRFVDLWHQGQKQGSKDGNVPRGTIGGHVNERLATGEVVELR